MRHSYWKVASWTVGGACVSTLAILAGCGGSSPPAEQPPIAMPEPAPPPEETVLPEQAASASQPEPEPEPVMQEEPPPEPVFSEGMSVNQALNAVPKGMPTINVEQDILSKPLQNMEVYEPCKLSQKQHFNLKVAVWKGKAVGMDVSTKPANPQLEQCLRQQIAGLKWEEEVASMNIIEYEY